ncbi:MAG: right-handed parallel beta-helix repeat-containing protein [Lentisphaerota bacterium]
MNRLVWYVTLILMSSCAGWAELGRVELSQSDFNSGATYSVVPGGNYLFTENITVTADVVGITINADHVTIDLNGFTFQGAAPAYQKAAIRQSASSQNAVVRNGFVTGWGGTEFYNAVIALQGKGNRVEDLTVSYNSGEGISVFESSMVRNCILHHNASHGVSAEDGSSVRECVAFWNKTGVRLENGGVAQECVLTGNTNGVLMVSNNVVRSCLIVTNVSALTFGGVDPGMNQIVNNHFVRNLQGIICNDHTVFAGNSGFANGGGDFSLAGDAVYGPILDVTGATALVTNNPNINFSLK